jgi:hypothetical protein
MQVKVRMMVSPSYCTTLFPSEKGGISLHKARTAQIHGTVYFTSNNSISRPRGVETGTVWTVDTLHELKTLPVDVITDQYG